MKTFRESLENLINSHSLENGSNTPDFILAGYLERCLGNFDATLRERESWYGRGVGTDAFLAAVAKPRDTTP